MSARAATHAVRLEAAAGGVAVISWRRPARRNALDTATVGALSDCLDQLHRHPPAALVLWGEGGDFSAGADLDDVRDLADRSRAEAVDFSRRAQALAAAVETLAAPTAAAIEGVCLGLGLEIALGAMVRIAASDARLGLPEMAHGLYPAAGGTARLPEAVGEGRARALILEGRILGAGEAHALGLVERLAAPGQARAAALAWAAEAAGVGEAAVRLLAARHAGRGKAFARALAAEREGFADLVRGAPARARLDAFVARRRKPGGSVETDAGGPTGGGHGRASDGEGED